MKYISVLILLVAMAWTWSMAQGSRQFGLSEHREMESQVEQIITEYLRQERPQLTDINFQQLYTEVVVPNKEIRVHLRYTLIDGTKAGDTTNENFQGVIVLKSNDGQTWTWAGEDIKAPFVEFKNGVRISPKDGDTTTAADPAATLPAAVDEHDKHE